MSKSFEKWFYEQIEETFGLQRVGQLVALTDWLNADVPISETDLARLQVYQKRLVEKVDDWNEEELKIFFIGPLLDAVDYTHPKYRPFLDRSLAAKLGNVQVAGVVDFMLASGKQLPKQPYFCLHEYKWSRGRQNDPLGQLLIAMLCAQAKNGNPQQPIYGLYVEGRFWYFVVLADKMYNVSLPFDASQAGLFAIFKMLRQLKSLIEPYLP